MTERAIAIVTIYAIELPCSSQGSGHAAARRVALSCAGEGKEQVGKKHTLFG